MNDELVEAEIVVSSRAMEPSRGAMIISLVDRAMHDHAFGCDLRHAPVATAARMGISLWDSEWAGLRDLLA